MKSGFLYIDKPAGISSFGVIRKVRGITGVKRVGHAGTLDPFATGLLIVAVGREYTKQLTQWLKKDKTYEATFLLGATSTTGDPEGEIIPTQGVQPPSEEDLRRVMTAHTGTLNQTPPAHSAIKVNGRRAYELARKGVEVQLPSREVTVHELRLDAYAYPVVQCTISVSSGTYIRSLAQDIGAALGTGAYLTALRRTRIDAVTLDQAVTLEQLAQDTWETFLHL